MARNNGIKTAAAEIVGERSDKLLSGEALAELIVPGGWGNELNNFSRSFQSVSCEPGAIAVSLALLVSVLRWSRSSLKLLSCKAPVWKYEMSPKDVAASLCPSQKSSALGKGEVLPLTASAGD